MHHTSHNIEEIFIGALEIVRPDDRSVYLDEVCGDLETRRRVERLLAMDAQASGFLEYSASPTTELWSNPTPVETPGTTIGPFRLIERLGDGGMGVVYRAEQTHPVHREVALKVIKPGMDSAQVVARFEVERQALALMDHPNIARVLDAGSTEGGRPYFVMDLVDGVPITAYCDQNHLPIAERLELFVLVCRAVQHAHQKGIIHRDLNPSNVLVTLQDGAPVPKVIDFGVAKATGQGLTADATLTGLAQVVGTPLYMSPEQADGSVHDVDTRSDVYSLGVLLYELLTGTTPFQPAANHQASFVEIRRLLREQEPPAPSTRLSTLSDPDRSSASANRQTDPRHLSRALHGELDWIVMKCLEKDRARRYESVSGLAGDLMRFLTDQPVEAGPPSMLYRVSKFARRNRVALMTVGLVMLSLLVGTAVSTWQAVEARRARRATAAALVVAQRQRETARRAVDKMYSEVAEEWLAAARHMTIKQMEFLREAMTFYQEFSQEQSADPEVQLAAALASNRVGNINRKALERFDEAVQAYRRSIAQLEPLARVAPENRDVQRILGESYRGLGAALDELHRSEQAEQAIRKALTIHRALVARSPTLEEREALSRDLNSLGFVSTTPNDEEATRREAIALDEQLVVDSSRAAKYRILLGKEIVGLAILHQKAGCLPDAEAMFQKSLEIWKQVVVDAPREQDGWDGLAMAHLNLARLHGMQTRVPQAEEEFREGLRILERLAADYPDVPHWRSRLADAHSGLAKLFWQESRSRDSEVEDRAALKIRRQLAAELREVPKYRGELAGTLSDLGATLRQQGAPRLMEAEAALRESQTLLRPLVAAYPSVQEYAVSLAFVTLNLGGVRYDEGKRLPEAEAPFLEAHTLFTRLARLEPKRPWYRYNAAACSYDLAQAQRVTPGRLPDAEASYREALATMERLAIDVPSVPDFRALHSSIQSTLADLLEKAGRLTEAESAYRSVIERDEKLVSEFPGDADLASQLGAALNNLAMCLRDRGDLAEARRLLERALVHQRAALKINPRPATYRTFLRSHLCVLAGVLVKLGDHKAAACAALELGESGSPEDSPENNALDAVDDLKLCVELADHDATLTPGQRQTAMATYVDRIKMLLRVLDRNFPADPFAH